VASGTLQREIESLIESKQEGGYWDFKQCHHANTADLLHDIICMSNNLVDRDAYIIFGVVDKTGKVVGVKHDLHRRAQQELVNQLKDKKFASDDRPNIEFVSLTVKRRTIDVLIVKNSTHTPYFLTHDYSDGHRTVHANYIYTRICDTNTDINKSADMNWVEYLWRKRFGIDKPILERYRILLSSPDDWVVDLGNKKYAYNRRFPEFHMAWGDVNETKGLWEACAAFYPDTEYMGVTTLQLLYHSTVIYETQLWAFDGSRVYVSMATMGAADDQGKLLYMYYDLSSIEGKLLRVFTNEHMDYAGRGLYCVQFLLFENEESRQRFNQYYLQHRDDFPDSELEKEFEFEILAEKQGGHRLPFSVMSIARAYEAYRHWTETGENPVRMARPHRKVAL
jgi:hypothetical protein